MPTGPEQETWRRVTRTPALVGSFAAAGSLALLLTTTNAVTGDGLGLVTPWLWAFTILWLVQVLLLRWRGHVGETEAAVHLVASAAALTADGLLQPVGFWQWVTAAVLEAVAVLGALVLNRLRAAVVCAAACAGIVAVVVHSYEDPLLRAALAAPVVVATLVPAGITFALTQRLEQLWVRARAAATTDPLTQLANRAGLSVQARRVIASAVGHDERVSVALLDVDHFKRINDGHGHAAGDAVLVAVADALRAEVRREDVLARTGGEELLVVSRVGSTDDVVAAAERLRRAVAGIALEGIPRVTASIGTATATRAEVRRALASGDRGAQDLLERLSGLADAAMYVAKNSGRNRVQHSSVRYGAVDPTTPPLRIESAR